MIDFHSHILPGMDDGSRDVQESLALLRMLADQGVTTVVATPHFYAEHESVDAFLARRNAAKDALSVAVTAALQEDASFMPPSVVCGAEVRYYAGVSHMEDLERLCLEGTKFLLVEMSMSAWSEYAVRELESMASAGRVRPIMAHLDRYMEFQRRRTLDRLYESGMLMQFNADFFLEKKRKALSMFRDGRIHLIGSDCHDLSVRPPHIGKAYAVIAKKFGERSLDRFNAMGASILGKA